MGLFSKITASLLIIIIFPVFFAIIIGCYLFQGPPIFFEHERIGYKFKKFNLIKFRSMRLNNNDNNITTLNDPRITKWGKVIRLTKLDETPQLWNIIKGDMRFVGPRPEVREFVNIQDFSFLNSIKPGLTDFSSIILRNEEKVLNNLGGISNYQELLLIKLELSHLYEKSKSFLLDLKIVILTIFSIFLPKIVSCWVNEHLIQNVDKNLSRNIKKILI